ncbi:MAG: hypothetical protein HRU36_03535 [Rickettsiales bacterium]|nr:hypothetical protein [Rickettsiales bacterium]
MQLIYNSHFARKALSTAITNPTQFLGISAGVVFTTFGVIYKYGYKVFYNLGSAAGIVYGNNQIAKFAIERENVGLYDFTATIAELLNWLSPTWFSTVDSDQALTKGITTHNRDLIDAALIHGADVNKESRSGERPIEQAINLRSESGYSIATQLVDADADLSRTTRAGTSLFNEAIHTGKTELVTAAMGQALSETQAYYRIENPRELAVAEQMGLEVGEELPQQIAPLIMSYTGRQIDCSLLIEKTDINGNNLAHFMPVSPDLQIEASRIDLIPTFTLEAVSVANHAGKTPLDIAFHAYRHGQTNEGLISTYTQKAPVWIVQPHFVTILKDRTLTHLVEPIIDKEGFDYNIPIGIPARLPLEHVLNYGNDALSTKVAKRTSTEILDNDHIWLAYRQGYKTTIEYFNTVIFTTTAEQASFLRSSPPEGEGGSFLHAISSRFILPDIAEFRGAYAILKEFSHSNPLATQDRKGCNVVYLASQNKNKVVLTAIAQIINEEGFAGNHLALLTDLTTLGSLHENGLLIDFHQAISSSELGYAMRGVMSSVVKQLSLPTMSSSVALTYPVSKESATLPSLAMTGIRDRDEFKSSALELPVSLSSKFSSRRLLIEDNIRELEKVDSTREQALLERLEYKDELDSKAGMPDEIKLVRIQVIESQQQENFIIGGMLAKQLILYKGLLKKIPGIDFGEGTATTLLTTVAFFGAGYSEAYGRGHSHARLEACIGAAMYGFAEFIKETPLPEYTPQEQRGIIDFLYKYSSNILASIPISLLLQGAFAITGGSSGGMTGMLKSAGITTSINLAQSYKLYTTDINDNSESNEFTYLDYVTLENTIATGVTIYVGCYYAPVLVASASFANSLAIGKFTLNIFSAISSMQSSFIVTKLTAETIEPITNFIVEHIQIAGRAVFGEDKESILHIKTDITELSKLFEDYCNYVLNEANTAYTSITDYIKSFHSWLNNSNNVEDLSNNEICVNDVYLTGLLDSQICPADI